MKIRNVITCWLAWGFNMAGLSMKLINKFPKVASKQDVSKKMHEQLKTCWREAVRAFILETIKHIRVDTGMSMASLYGVASNSTIRIGNVMWAELLGKGPHRPKQTYVTLDGTVMSKQYKSKELGQQLGKDPKTYEIGFGTPQNLDLLFRFKVVVYQYKLRENGFDGEAPWDSIGYGKLAFLEAWHREVAMRITSQSILRMLFPRGRITKR
jgi:hypothetical protein